MWIQILHDGRFINKFQKEEPYTYMSKKLVTIYVNTMYGRIFLKNLAILIYRQLFISQSTDSLKH